VLTRILNFPPKPPIDDTEKCRGTREGGGKCDADALARRREATRSRVPCGSAALPRARALAGDGTVGLIQEPRQEIEALNRMLYKNYNDTSTARACYAYDGEWGMAFGDTALGATGHLTSSWSVQHDGTVLAANETYQFDPMGRPQLAKQCTPATCGLTNYLVQTGYDLMGNPINLWESSVARYTPFDAAADRAFRTTIRPPSGKILGIVFSRDGRFISISFGSLPNYQEASQPEGISVWVGWSPGVRQTVKTLFAAR